jgi:thiosulfate/3-mercaptopyruvate sulfurtransferase
MMVAGRIHYLTTVVVEGDFRLACVRSVRDIRRPEAPRLGTSFRVPTWPAGLLLLVGWLWTLDEEESHAMMKVPPMWSVRRSLMLGLWTTSSNNTIGLVGGLSFSGGNDSSKDSATSTTRISIGEAIETFDTLTFIDASWYHKGDRNGRDEYLRGPRIANAVYYDLSSSSSSSDGTAVSSLAAQQMDDLGITNHDTNIVVYGHSGAFFLPRVWFTIRHLLGHQSCRLLDGTLDDWTAAGGNMDYRTIIPEKVVPTSAATSVGTDGQSSPSYQPQYQPNVLIGLEEMKQFVMEERGVIWDARGSSFAKEGHMPGAIHIPYSSLHDANGRLYSTDRIATLLPPLPTVTADVVVTCGSGVSACTLFWALHELGHRGRVRVYDGSWAEWKRLDDVPKVLPATASPSSTSS